MTLIHFSTTESRSLPKWIAIALIVTGGLGCTQEKEDDPAPAPAPAASSVTTGGDGSEIQMDPLTEGDVNDAELSGELACSFSEEDAPPILYATGVVASNEPSQGIVKVSGYVERIGAPGGVAGITDDPVFTGRGKTISIAIRGPAIGGGESPPRPATLTYERADGASRSFEGIWRCGP